MTLPATLKVDGSFSLQSKIDTPGNSRSVWAYMCIEECLKIRGSETRNRKTERVTIGRKKNLFVGRQEEKVANFGFAKEFAQVYPLALKDSKTI